MTTYLTIHLACNNTNGVHTGHCDAVAIYHDGIEPLVEVEGDAIACGIETTRNVDGEDVQCLVLTIGDLECEPTVYSWHVGNLIWDSATISLADAAHVVNLARRHGWSWVVGRSRLWVKFSSEQDVSAVDLEAALSQLEDSR